MNNSSTHHQSISHRSETISVSSKKKYKIILLGDSGTGKTSIISRFINNTFEPNQDPTIGIDFLVKNMNYKGHTVRVQLWDTAGQEKFKSLIPSYLKDATAAIFVFDFARLQTLKNLQDWIALYRDNNNHQGGSKALVGMLCGNKADLQQQKLDKQKLYQLMDRYKFPYQSVSAKTGSNIQQLFYLTLQMIVTKHNEQKNAHKKKMQKKDFYSKPVQEENHQDQEGHTQRGPQTQTRLKTSSQKSSAMTAADSKAETDIDDQKIELSKGNETTKRNCMC